MNIKLIIFFTTIIIFLSISVFSQETDTSIVNSENINFDTVKKEKKHLFGNKKSERTTTKPEPITGSTWKQKNMEGKDSLLLEWSKYDREYYSKKYAPSEFEKKKFRKQDKNFFDKMIISHANKKPLKYTKKLISKKNKRFKKTLKFDSPKKMSEEEWDATSPEDRMIYIVKKNRYEGQKEAIRKNNVIKKYEKREEKIKKKYSLSIEEKTILNKGSSMHLRGTEQLIYNKAKTKQEKYSTELLEIRRKRQLEIQNPDTQKKMKKKMKENEKKYGEKSKYISEKEKQALKNEKKKKKQKK
jgi:hypothetical protein